MAEGAGLVVRRGLERGGKRHHQRRVRRRPRLRGDQRGEHAPGGREPRVEQLLRFVLAAFEADPGRGAQHHQQHRDAAAEQDGTGRARLQAGGSAM